MNVMYSILIIAFDINYWKMRLSFTTFNIFRYQILEDKPEIHDIQSSKIVGSVCNQSPRFNVSKTWSEECSLNHQVDFNHAKITIVCSDNQDDSTNTEEDNDTITLVTENVYDTSDRCIIAQSSICDKKILPHLRRSYFQVRTLLLFHRS